MSLRELWHKLGSPRWFYQMSSPWVTGLGAVAFVLLSVGMVWGLVFAPQDYQQGNSFRIIYIHVPTAIVSQSTYLLLGSAGLVLLVLAIAGPVLTRLAIDRQPAGHDLLGAALQQRVQ